MKIIEYLKENSLFDGDAYTYPEFLDTDLRSMIDRVVLTRFGLRELQERVKVFSNEAEWDIPDTVHFLVYSITLEKEYKWKTLLATENFEYNPIENYDRAETESITRNQGAQSNSNTIGATHETVAEGAHTDTTTESRSAENSTGYQPDGQTQTAYGAISTTTEANARSDSQSIGARQDSESRTLSVSGNIGTVTSQDMIKQEREIADFSALYEIAHDIVNEIGEGVL